MTAQELQALVAGALETVREMDARSRQLAVDSGLLDRRVAQSVRSTNEHSVSRNPHSHATQVVA